MNKYLLPALAVLVVIGCESGIDTEMTTEARRRRRLYDGAPPVIAHQPFNIPCKECHNRRGIEVPDLGFAPPTPHSETPGMSKESRCVQCHVFRNSDQLFVDNEHHFPWREAGAERAHPLAPPVIPHETFMRADCLSCHDNPTRREIRCSHPERGRCRQCHVPVRTQQLWGEK